jgi:hypothetical protein
MKHGTAKNQTYLISNPLDAKHTSIPKEKRFKLDWNAHIGQIVGYGGTNQYRIWDPERGDVCSISGCRIRQRPRHRNNTLGRYPRTWHTTSSFNFNSNGNRTGIGIGIGQRIGGIIRRTCGSTYPHIGNKGRNAERFEDIDWNTKAKRKASARIARAIENDDDNDDAEPKTYSQAVNHPVHGSQWREAIHTEFRSLIKNMTWRPVKRPNNRNIGTCKWVFKHKKDQDVNIIHALSPEDSLKSTASSISTHLHQSPNWTHCAYC